MKNQGQSVFTLIALLLLAIICVGVTWASGLTLGIDLSGGTILVYQVREGEKVDRERMEKLIGSLKRRVNASGVKDIPIRPVGNNRVEVILAEASPEEVERTKRQLTDVGSLEFRILANRKHDSLAIERALAEDGLKTPPKGYRWAKLGEVVEGKKPTTEEGRLVDLTKSWGGDRYKESKVLLTGKDSRGKEITDEITIAGNDATSLTLARPQKLKTVDSYRIDYNPSGIVPSDFAIVRDAPRGDGTTDRYILIGLDRYNVKGEDLARAYPTTDERVQPAVGFLFKPSGSRRFGNLTRDHLPEENGAFKYRLAVILDDVVRSAPAINQEIRDSGIIEGVRPDEVTYLIEILESGSLPASIDPIPLLEEKVGPTLGRDTIEKGLRAITISMLVVPLFMIFYYRFAGMVAVLALVLNMLLLVASMALTGSSFTLPGLAGLALTIGMAVDANVLIFERMREEKERGATMAQQVRNGFNRAWTTILDSNVTTMLSGAVLWWVGTEEVKGFALTLIIGLIWNLFTAVFVSRLIFEFWLSKGWLKKLTMMKALDRTNIDFVGPRRIMMGVSALIVALGLALFFSRGVAMYNIDFTGGTLVTIQLDQDAAAVKDLNPARRAGFVRSTAGAVLKDVSVESLNVADEQEGIRFNVRTTEQDQALVQGKILEAFDTTLARVTLTHDNGTPIPGKPAPAEAETKDSAKTAETPQLDNPWAGGRAYALNFNRPVEPDTVSDKLTRLLRAAGVANPERRFSLVADAPETAGAAANRAQGVRGIALKTDVDADTIRPALASLATALRDDPSLLFDRLENFGGAVAGEARGLAIMAIVFSWLIIIAYLWFRFKSVSYGLGAVIALVHDVLFTMGALALFRYKIDLPMIAAFLTLIGFSVNDTIVIFDRIREIKGKTPGLTPEIVNAAINQTLSRTILTSLTAFLVVAILFFFGGEGLRGFSFCLVVGFVSGTYSTIAIAAPVLVEWNKPRKTAGDRTLVGSRKA